MWTDPKTAILRGNITLRAEAEMLRAVANAARAMIDSPGFRPARENFAALYPESVELALLDRLVDAMAALDRGEEPNDA